MEHRLHNKINMCNGNNTPNVFQQISYNCFFSKCKTGTVAYVLLRIHKRKHTVKLNFLFKHLRYSRRGLTSITYAFYSKFSANSIVDQSYAIFQTCYNLHCWLVIQMAATIYNGT